MPGEEGDDRWGGPRDALKDRVHRTLRQRLWLRLHTALITGSAVVLGLLVSTGLQAVESVRFALGLRYGVACLIAYAWFLLVVRWWVRYIAGIRPRVGVAEDDRGRFDPGALARRAPDRPVERSPAGDAADGCLDLGGLPDIEGCAVVVALILAVVAVSWFLSFGSAVLAEIVADTLLAGGLLRWARNTEGAWASSSLRATRIPFVIITAAFVGFGFWAETRCPMPSRFGEIWICLSR